MVEKVEKAAGDQVERIEGLSPDSAATHLHYDVADDCIWLDTDVGVHDGLVVGVGVTRALAIEDARRELLDRLADLERATNGESVPSNR